MARFHGRLVALSATAAALVVMASAPLCALTLVFPTQDQTVRESVKISVPVSELPPDFVIPKGEPAPEKGRPFIAVLVGNVGQEKLVGAMSADEGKVVGGTVSFFWDSKAPYRDPAEPRTNKYFKDGRYSLKVEIHDSQGKTSDSATVNIDLKNKVPRPNPAPAIKLINNLNYGQSNVYRVRADLQVFHVVNNVGLPILGGMGLTSDTKILQSVEDIRPNGEILLRCKMDASGYTSSFGQKRMLFPADQPKPQLYRLVDKRGNVITRNVFSRQGKYTIMDVLPVLPGRPVREGDSWPTTMDIKIEGITRVIPLTGSSMLDSFEWQNGQACAKIISSMTGNSRISMNGGKIRSSSDRVDVEIVTYFAYKTGRMIRREFTLDFPAAILPGAEEFTPETEGGAQPTGANPMASMMRPFTDMAATANDLMDDPYGTGKSSPGREPGVQTPDGSVRKGSVQARIVIGLEK